MAQNLDLKESNWLSIGEERNLNGGEEIYFNYGSESRPRRV